MNHPSLFGASIPAFMRLLRLVPAVLVLPVLAVAVGCGPKPEANVPPAPADPEGFLKWSMSRYQGLKALKADCEWSASLGDAMQPPKAKRSLLIAPPNRYRVDAKNSEGIELHSVSDGQAVLDWSNKEQLNAIKTSAPANIADSTSPLIKNPIACGTLLYNFFGGPEKLDTLVDKSKGAVSFGPDVTVDNVPCKTVTFFAQGIYGKTKVAIGATDGLVRRIEYGLEPLIARSAGQPGAPTKAEALENYTNIAVNSEPAASEFEEKPPAGMKIADMSGADAPGGAPGGDEENPPPPVPLGQPAPDFEVAKLSGEKVKLSSLRGKVVLIDFWATWCPPCKKGLPETEKLHKEFVGKGLAVMTVSAEDKATVEPYVRQQKFTFPAYVDTDRSASLAYKADAIPTVAIIAKDGKLAAYFVGLQSPATIRAALKRAGLAM